MPATAGRFLRIAAIGPIVLLAGCAAEDPPLADVTGDVTYNGRPAEAEIIFEPEGDGLEGGGRPSVATSDLRGRFTLQFTAERDGAVIGPHRVLVKVLRPDRAEARSLDEATSPVKTARLERTVAADGNHFHFVLTP